MYCKKMQGRTTEKDLPARLGSLQGVRTFIKQGLISGSLVPVWALSVYTDVLPVVMALDERGVKADLLGKRVEHGVFSAGNSGVGRDLFLLFQARGKGRSDTDSNVLLLYQKQNNSVSDSNTQALLCDANSNIIRNSYGMT